MRRVRAVSRAAVNVPTGELMPLALVLVATLGAGAGAGKASSNTSSRLRIEFETESDATVCRSGFELLRKVVSGEGVDSATKPSTSALSVRTVMPPPPLSAKVMKEILLRLSCLMFLSISLFS